MDRAHGGLDSEGNPSVIQANWRLAQASAQLAIGGYDSSSVVIDDLEVSRDGAMLVKTPRAEFHTRPNRTDPVSIDVVAKFNAATSGLRPMTPVDAEIQFVARKLLRNASRPQPLPLRQWVAAGGRVDLVLLRLAQGPGACRRQGQYPPDAGRPAGR